MLRGREQCHSEEEKCRELFQLEKIEKEEYLEDIVRSKHFFMFIFLRSEQFDYV